MMMDKSSYFSYLRDVLGIKGILTSETSSYQLSKRLLSSASIQFVVSTDRTSQETQLLYKIKKATEEAISHPKIFVEIQEISGQIQSLQMSPSIPTYFILLGESLLTPMLRDKWSRGAVKANTPKNTWMWTHSLNQILSADSDQKRMHLKQTVWKDIKNIIYRCSA